MIKILDEINNVYTTVERDMNMNMMIIHPLNKETTFLKDVELEGHIKLQV